MNTPKLILSGLLAGLVLNIGEATIHGAIYANATAEALQALGHGAAGSTADTAQLVLVTFMQGLIGMLLYVAVQPGWKSGIATAIRIGLILWVLSAAYSGVYLSAGLSGLLPAHLTWGPVAYELLLYPLAIVCGSLVYRP